MLVNNNKNKTVKLKLCKLLSCYLVRDVEFINPSKHESLC